MKICDMIALLSEYPPDTMMQCVILDGCRGSIQIARDLGDYHNDPEVTIMVHHAHHVDLPKFEKCMEGLKK